MSNSNSMVETVAVKADKVSAATAVKKNLREYGMLISLVAIMVFFQYMTEGTLMQPLNLTNLVLQNSYIVIMALAMLLVIVAGHIDLSVGSVAGFIGGLAAVLMVEYHWHYIPATLSVSPRVLSSGARGVTWLPSTASPPSSLPWAVC